RQVRFDLLNLIRADNQRRDSRVCSDELHSGSVQGDVVALADGFEATCLFPDLWWRKLILVGGGFGVASCQNAAVVDAARKDAYPFFLEQLESIQRGLLQQCVAPGQQEAVEISIAGEISQHLPLVHARADSLNHALTAQLSQGGEGFVERLVIMIVGVMDVQDVDAVNFESVEAVLDALHHLVAGEVKSKAAFAIRQPPDFGCQHITVTRDSGQRLAQIGFSFVQWGGIQKGDAEFQRPLDDGDGLRSRPFADVRCPQPDATYFQVGLPNLYHRELSSHSLFSRQKYIGCPSSRLLSCKTRGAATKNERA